jgi:hypothetical protein
LEGLDDIGVSLREEDSIRAFEVRLAAERPWLIALAMTTDIDETSETAATTNLRK